MKNILLFCLIFISQPNLSQAYQSKAIQNDVQGNKILASERDFKRHFVILWQTNNGYALHIYSTSRRWLHKTPPESNFIDLLNPELVLETTRSIVVPVDIEVELKGLDQSFQVGGKSDVDIRTGRFTHFIGKKFQDFFADYQGTSFNIGLGIGGTGYSYGTNKNGIVLRDLNATLIFPAPILLGLNVGLSAYSYTLKITPATDSVDVTFNETMKEKSKVTRSVDVQENWDIQKLLETELRN